MSALPTRKDEDFRYADLAALTPLWPVPVERIALGAGEAQAMSVDLDGDIPVARELSIVLAPGAAFDVRVLSAGDAYARVALHVELGEGARFTLGGAQLASGGNVLEIVTNVVHAGPDAQSRQVVRSVAAGRGTVNYLGKVRVADGANGTDAEQSVRTMLLDRTASANARPELEIYADDVKCAHGCAVGELDAAALFYLQSRGLPPAEARRLMLQAFIAEAFVGADDEEGLQARALAALSRLEALA